MKKLILICLVTTFSITCALAKVHVHRSGSLDGQHYGKVTEDHTGIWPFESHTLSCTGPGQTLCSWTQGIAPKVISSSGEYTSNEIENWVIAKIATGTIFGKAYFNGDILVVWKKNDTVLDISMFNYDEDPI